MLGKEQITSLCLPCFAEEGWRAIARQPRRMSTSLSKKVYSNYRLFVYINIKMKTNKIVLKLLVCFKNKFSICKLRSKNFLLLLIIKLEKLTVFLLLYSLLLKLHFINLYIDYINLYKNFLLLLKIKIKKLTIFLFLYSLILKINFIN